MCLTKLDTKKMWVSFDFQISLFRDLISHVISHVLRMIYNQYRLFEKNDHNSQCTNVWIVISKLLCNHKIKTRMFISEEIIFFDDVHSHWEFIKFSSSSTSTSIDSLLLIRELVVARIRERFLDIIIELSSQAELSKIISQEEISTQRNSSQFEMIENVVSSKKQVFIRDRVVTWKRERERDRDRDRDRERFQEREREDKDDINASTKKINEIIQ